MSFPKMLLFGEHVFMYTDSVRIKINVNIRNFLLLLQFWQYDSEYYNITSRPATYTSAKMTP